MKVKQLIKKLQTMNPNANVYTYDDRRCEYWLLDEPVAIEEEDEDIGMMSLEDYKSVIRAFGLLAI